MTITVTASGISLDGPLVAGEVVAVSVSGVTFAEDAKPTLCLLGRFPDALLSSVELAEDENTPGTWTGSLDTATKQTAVFFATARADECRDAVLELVAARQSVARLMVAFRNSALCPSPFHAPDASPVYIPVPGPQGEQGEPGDETIAFPGGATNVPASQTSIEFAVGAIKTYRIEIDTQSTPRTISVQRYGTGSVPTGRAVRCVLQILRTRATDVTLSFFQGGSVTFGANDGNAFVVEGWANPDRTVNITNARALLN